MSPWIIWLIVSAVLALIELIFGAFAAFCPAFGALFGAAAAAMGLGLEWQLVAAIVGGGLAFMFLTPLINRNRHKGNEYSSNMDALIGREARVNHAYQGTGSSLGRVRIDGDNWQFETTDGSPAEHGELVRVEGYDSIILKVKKV